MARVAQRRRLAAIAGAVVTGAAAWALTAPAVAHVHLLHTDPANGAVITRPLKTIKLHFNSAVEKKFARFELRRAGRVVTTRPLRRTNQTTMVAGLGSRLRRGAYVARFRVMSGDGHPIAGQWTFSVRSRHSR